MKIEKDKFVTLTYSLVVDGQVADKADRESPLGFVFEAGYLLPAFEAELKGKKEGDKFEFTLTPEQGYGVPDPRMIAELDRSVFMVNGAVEESLLEIGNEIPMMTAEGMRLVGRVAKTEGDKVTMDFNHPMAGKMLNFSGEVIGVREATDDDFPNDCGGGCNCNDSGCEDCGCGCQ